jgi:hypothetical protein
MAMMCKTCVDVIRQYAPGFKNVGIGSTEEIADILWSQTAFPFCGPEQMDEQLAEFYYYKGLGISLCCFCGTPIRALDGRFHMGATCIELQGGGFGCAVLDEGIRQNVREA